jgi:hypothetical protein
VPDASAPLKIRMHAGGGFKVQLLDHDRQYRRRDLRGRNGECAQKSDARQHYGKAKPIMVAAQRSNEVAIGLIQMEISRKLVGRRFTVEASKPLALGVSEVTGRHTVRNFQLLRRRRAASLNKAHSFAKHPCETKSFCSNFRTMLGTAA